MWNKEVEIPQNMNALNNAMGNENKSTSIRLARILCEVWVTSEKAKKNLRSDTVEQSLKVVTISA